jgi:multidrug efflux pump subunit AcrA (membrane-fusion protein)
MVERHLFAPADGVVEQVLVDYGDPVEADQQVVLMNSPDYELQIKTLQGELSAARKKLEANQLLRSQANREGRDAVTVGRLTAEIEQNRLEIESINQNIKLYLNLLDQLDLKSPIKGRVISRDVELSLLNRPVRRGDRLMTIADTSADWQVVFEVRDRDFGYLQDARESGTLDDLVVHYRLSSDPGRTIESVVQRIDDNNTIDADGNALVRLYVPFDAEDAERLRVGTSVVGKIDCGRKSLFFIWTRDVRDFIRANFFWL